MSEAFDEHRELCPDGACTGLIGTNGKCKVCGTPLGHSAGVAKSAAVQATALPSRGQPGEGGFGYKDKWLAVQSRSPKAVIAALGLKNAQQVSWARGVGQSGDSFAFVTEPIVGWILVKCSGFPDFGDERHPDLLTPRVVELSRRLNADIQAFVTHRVVEYHGWVWVHAGHVIRHFAYTIDDGPFINEGVITPAEKLLALQLDDTGSDEFEFTPPDEKSVMRVAADWSVDPTTLPNTGSGWIAELPA